MSIETVTEVDMKTFLDSEIQEEEKTITPREEEAVLYANRNWETEVRVCLKRNDVNAAQRIYDDLKKHYTESPESHLEERKKLYEHLQSTYILIYNYMRERARTAALLQQLSQNPDAVFDVRVRPINLQTVDRSVDHSKRLQLPEYEPLTKQALQQRFSGEEPPLGPVHEASGFSMPSPPPGFVHPDMQPLQPLPQMSAPAFSDMPARPAYTPAAMPVMQPARREIAPPTIARETATPSMTNTKPVTSPMEQEAVIVEHVKPYLQRIKHARKGSAEHTAAIQELRNYVQQMPQSQYKTTLEQTLATLAPKNIIKNTRNTVDNEDQAISFIMPYILRMKAAKQRRDKTSLFAALDELVAAVNNLEPSAVQMQLITIIDLFHSKLRAKVYYGS